jgi:hypothetical protein
MLDALVIGGLVLGGLLLIGLDYPLVLALVAVLGELVPVLGPFISAAPALAIALLTKPEQVLIVLAFYVAVEQVEGHVLTRTSCTGQRTSRQSWCSSPSLQAAQPGDPGDSRGDPTHGRIAGADPPRGGLGHAAVVGGRWRVADRVAQHGAGFYCGRANASDQAAATRRKKNARAAMAYTPRSWTPSSHELSPSMLI